MFGACIEGNNDNGDDDEDDHHLEIHGAYVLDLIAGTSTPALDTAVLDSGAYNEIKLKLGPCHKPPSNMVLIKFIPVFMLCFLFLPFIIGKNTSAMATSEIRNKNQ